MYLLLGIGFARGIAACNSVASQTQASPQPIHVLVWPVLLIAQGVQGVDCSNFVGITDPRDAR